MIEPQFSRSEVAKILGVHPLTIANREKAGKYPQPSRDLNGWRKYSLNEVFNLQLITYRSLEPRTIISVLYDRGEDDPKEISRFIDSALTKRTGA